MFVGVQLTVVSVAGEFLRDSEHVEAQRSREPAAQNVFPFGAVAFRDRSVPPCAPSKTLALSTAFSCLVCLASLFSSDSQRVETASENGCFSHMQADTRAKTAEASERVWLCDQAHLAPWRDESHGDSAAQHRDDLSARYEQPADAAAFAQK